ncbi:TPA: colicin E1 family microcin immunity protein [Klebsiella pneumoniae]|uniref:colicin E1 family microcin immunity protein n=1 Tax=Klebsiella pneumoniae complex TaxID=3390273 RepID=UPI000D742FAF|nr:MULTISPECIES: colicin E1 family microcin immunity protein [Klebsiella]HCI6639433.1 hypothetical protein [Klebsiella variicola subsp. variicola]HDT4792266.1 hypothetical protein [Klebsiella pneumoniae subsp. pneumoniae]MBQ5243702.1 hypothetical protein [Klebsiella pneumoniae]MCP6113838.1 colicin E1 immunity protein [Klebsiella pneumoniae]PXK96865.1 hypothetical protein DMS11_12430 [Klebsiella variicola]
MSIKYYFSKIFWSLLISGVIFFNSNGNESAKILYFNVFSLISAILFPFSWYQIEKIALKYRKEKFWTTGLFKDGVPKTYLVTLFVLMNFIVSIPFGLFCILNEIKKGRHNKDDLDNIKKLKK